MVNFIDLFKAYKESKSDLPFPVWRAQQNITEPKENITLTPIIRPIKKEKPNSNFKDVHLRLDKRIPQALKDETLSKKINDILLEYLNIDKEVLNNGN